MAGGKAASRLQKDLDEVWDYITERDRAVVSAESEKRKHLEKRVRVAEEPRHVRVSRWLAQVAIHSRKTFALHRPTLASPNVVNTSRYTCGRLRDVRCKNRMSSPVAISSRNRAP